VRMVVIISHNSNIYRRVSKIIMDGKKLAHASIIYRYLPLCISHIGARLTTNSVGGLFFINDRCRDIYIYI